MSPLAAQRERSHARVRVSLPVEVLPDDGRVLRGTLEDMSVGGLCIIADVDLPEGTSSTLMIQEPGSVPLVEVEARGVVVRRRPPRLAFEIVALDVDDYDDFRRLIVTGANGDPQVLEELEANRGVAPPLAPLKRLG